MHTKFKILSLVTMGLIMSACQNTPTTGPDRGSSYTMPNVTSGKGVYNVIMDGKKRRVVFDPTDLDVLSEDACSICGPDTLKEVAIIRTHRELETRVGDYTPNIIIEDVDLYTEDDNMGRVGITFYLKVAHSAGPNANLGVMEVPLFFAAADIPTQEVYSNGHAMARVDLNRSYETQVVRAWFDINDLKARGLRGWSLLVGISKSEANRKFEEAVTQRNERVFAQADRPEENKTRTGNIPTTLRASETSAPDLIEK